MTKKADTEHQSKAFHIMFIMTWTHMDIEQRQEVGK